jgi:hypothetical protein
MPLSSSLALQLPSRRPQIGVSVAEIIGLVQEFAILVCRHSVHRSATKRADLLSSLGWVCTYLNQWHSQCLVGPPPTVECNISTSLPQGNGAYALGGGNRETVVVTSCDALKAAAQAGKVVIRLSGLLDGCGIIDIALHTSILGVGNSSGKQLFWMKERTNTSPRPHRWRSPYKRFWGRCYSQFTVYRSSKGEFVVNDRC